MILCQLVLVNNNRFSANMIGVRAALGGNRVVNMRYWIGALLILLMTACSSSVGDSPTATPKTMTTIPNLTAISTPMTTVAPTQLPIPTLTPAPTSRPTQPSEPQPITPSIKARCPAQPEVSLSELGLESTSHLIVVPTDDGSSTQWTLLGRDLTPKRILDSTFDGKPLSFGGTAPDQRWFAFYSLGKNEPNLDLWISSIDGTTQQLALENLEHPNYFQWLNNQTIVMYERSDLPWYTTSVRIDPFTSESISLAPVFLDFGIYAFSPDVSQVIYLEGFPYAWKLYDYTANSKQTILPWMDASRIELPNYASVSWTEHGVSVALMDATAMELVVNLPSDSLSQMDVPRHRILFSDKSTAWGFNWWSSDNRLIAFRRAFGESNGIPTGPIKFYILDTVPWVLYDYCLPEDLIPDFLFASADQRFLSWTGIQSNIMGTVVMEIATGRRAWLSGWKTLGWGEVNEK